MTRKKIAVFAALCASALYPLAAAELSASVDASNYAFDGSGDINPESPKFGAAFSFTDRILDNLDGTLAFDSNPVNGNILSARASWSSSLLQISAGPSFGVLNTSSSDSEIVANLFQPGLGIGFVLKLPGILVAEADTDFALPPPAETSGQVYLQRSRLSAGFFLPNVLCTLAIRQDSNSQSASSVTKVKSITDYGLYTEAFRKGSPWRVGVDFIYRVCDYYEGEDSDANRIFGNLVLGGKLTWAPKNDLSVFIAGDGSLYSFALSNNTVDGLSNALYQVKVGFSVDTDKFSKKKAALDDAEENSPNAAR